jgi:hypothetical protein
MGGEPELDPAVGGERSPDRGGLRDVRVQPPEVPVEDVDLTDDLGVADVLRIRVVHHVHDDGDLGHTDPGGFLIAAFVGEGAVLDGLASRRVRGVLRQQPAVRLHRSAEACGSPP